MLIRDALESDLPAILDIYNYEILHGVATFDTEAKTLEDRHQWFRSRGTDYPILVAEENGTVLGWASVGPWSERKAYQGTVENSVYVQKNFQGRGIGKLLLEALILETRKKGYHTIIARIAESNATSVRLHQQQGFVTIGVLKEVGHKFNRLLDVTLMQKIL
jgi:phosphinothricin acetyltransferase